MKHWYALRSRDELVTAAFLAEAGYAAYVPCEIVHRRVAGKLVPHRRPLVRGYVFVHCSELALGVVRAIGASEGFICYASLFGEKIPRPLAPNDLVPLILAELFGEFDHTREPKAWTPSRGDMVRIVRGRWQGFIGRIISVGRRRDAIIDAKWCRMNVQTKDLEAVA